MTSSFCLLSCKWPPTNDDQLQIAAQCAMFYYCSRDAQSVLQGSQSPWLRIEVRTSFERLLVAGLSSVRRLDETLFFTTEHYMDMSLMRSGRALAGFLTDNMLVKRSSSKCVPFFRTLNRIDKQLYHCTNHKEKFEYTVWSNRIKKIVFVFLVTFELNPSIHG